jgi:diguanylate cyclase (GGDEF)-like protein/PAS domain S-box-containing protein
MKERIYKNILDSLDSPVFLIDPDRKITYQNARARKFSGIKEEDMASYTCYDLFGDADKKCLHECIVERVIQGETFHDVERTIRTRKGLSITVTLSATPFLFHGSIAGAIVILKGSTVTQSEDRALAFENNNESLHIYDIYDEDTERSDKDHFLEHLKSDFSLAQKYKAALSLLIFEIDEFKKIEKDFGHTYADSLIEQVRDLLIGRVRRSDLIYRYNEGQIAIILPYTLLRSAVYLAEELRKMIHVEFKKGGENLTVSVGVAELQPDIKHFLELLEQAAQGMEKAKKIGDTVISLQAM